MDFKGIICSFFLVDLEGILMLGNLEESFGKSLEVFLIGVSRVLMILDIMVGILGLMRVD